jgi:O-antigen ligase
MTNKVSKQKSTVSPGYRSVFLVVSILLYFVLPLFYLSSAQDAVLIPRLLLLVIILGGLILHGYFTKQVIFSDALKNPVAILFGLFALATLLPVFIAFNPAEGLFDVVKTITTAVVFILLILFIKTQQDWFNLLSRILLFSLLLAVLIGFYQYLVLLGKFPSGKLDNRQSLVYGVTGLMGNKNAFSSYLMLLLPFTLHLAYSARGIWRIGAIFASAAGMVLLLMLGTRAVWLGTMAGGIAMVLITLIFRAKLGIQPKTIKRMVITTVVLLGLTTAIAIEGGRFTNLSLFKQVGSIMRPDAGNNHFRLKIWKITSQMAMNQPMTGVGTGNWQIVIPEYYHTIGLKGKEVNWITPHNDFLWIFSEKGFPGLILYLGLIGAALWMFFRLLLRSKSSADNLLIAVILFAGLVAYLVVACFDFPYQRIDHQILFATFLAGLTASYLNAFPAPQKAINRHLFFIPVLLLLCFSLLYSWQSLMLEVHVEKAEKLMQSGKLADAREEISLARTPFRTLDAVGSPVSFYAGLIQEKSRNNQGALGFYRAALSDHPNHIALLNNLGKSYFMAGYYRLAEYYYKRVLKIVPGYKETRINLSTLYYKQGDYDQSLEMLLGIKGARQIPDVYQNITVLQKKLGIQSGNSLKEEKFREKWSKKSKKKKARSKRD